MRLQALPSTLSEYGVVSDIWLDHGETVVGPRAGARMTFLHPFVLIGLAAAAIPVVLHLLTLRRLRTVDFSTLEFLKELQKSRIRRLQLRQWLLLLLRTLLILLLVFAFSRPTLEGSLPDAWGTEARTTAVIIVDDSYSMTATDDRGERLRQAREAVGGIIRSLSDGDEVAVMPFSHSGSERSGEMTSILPLAQDEANHVTGSAVRRPLEFVLQKAAELLTAARSANKELYVVSDLQQTLLRREASSVIPAFQGADLHCFVVPIGDDVIPNISLASSRSVHSLVDLGHPFPVDAVLANRGDAPATGITVSLFFGDERVDQRARDVAAGSSVDVSLSGVPRTPGFITGRMVLEGDDLEFDNQRSFVLRLRPESRVLLVGSDEDLRFVRMALQTRGDSTGAAVRLDSVTPDRLTETRLPGYDAYVIAVGHPNLDRWAPRWRSLVERGAGLVLLPGATTTSWGAIGEAFGLGSAPAITTAGGSFIAFRSADLDHPIFDGMFEPVAGRERDRRQVPTPEIQRFLPTRVAPGGVAVVTLSTGQPFIVERPVGRGRIVAFASAAAPSWSDLTTQGLFVPLVHRSLAVVSGAQDLRPVVTAGEGVSLPIPTGVTGTAQVITPDRQSITVAPTSTPVGAVLDIPSLNLPGTYSVMMEGREVDRFSVTIDERESDTRPSTTAERAAFFESVGLAPGQWSVLEPSDDMDRVVQEARFGAELWRIFLLAALIVAVAESLVAARWKSVDQRGTP